MQCARVPQTKHKPYNIYFALILLYNSVIMAKKEALLAHHESVIQSLLRSEEWRVSDGKTPRTSLEIAKDWAKGQEGHGAQHYREALSQPRTSQRMSRKMAELIDNYQRGNLEAVGDFRQKRDGLCEACGVTRKSCWRKSELSIPEAIKVLRGKG